MGSKMMSLRKRRWVKRVDVWFSGGLPLEEEEEEEEEGSRGRRRRLRMVERYVRRFTRASPVGMMTEGRSERDT